MLNRMRFPFVNTYQNDDYYRSESPVDEVWDRLSRYSSIGILNKDFSSDIHPEMRDELMSYISTRMSQAIEFRNASHGQTLLTKPLNLYYAMLNLLRADIAIKYEIKAERAHGLSFKAHKNIMESSVAISGGTFKQYLEHNGISLETNLEISFYEALSNIIEIGSELMEDRDIDLGFTPFIITAYSDGDLAAIPFNRIDDFENKWKTEYPKLANDFSFTVDRLIYHMIDLKM